MDILFVQDSILAICTTGHTYSYTSSCCKEVTRVIKDDSRYFQSVCQSAAYVDNDILAVALVTVTGQIDISVSLVYSPSAVGRLSSTMRRSESESLCG